MNIQVGSTGRRRPRFGAYPSAARGKGGSGGFTLIEVVLALTIFALLVSIVYGALSLSQRAVAKAQTSADRNQKQRSTVDLFGSYIRSAYPYRPTPQDQTIFFDGGSDSLTFVSAYSHALGGRGMAKIQIRAEETEDGQAALSLEETTPVRLNGDGDNAGQSQPLVLRERIKDFRFAYLDPQLEEETWEERWDGQERRMLPRAVRLTYRDESGREVRWVFPVMMMVLAP
jgi:general secretion pathway protein J